MSEQVPPKAAPPESVADPNELSEEDLNKVSGGAYNQPPRPMPMLPVDYVPSPPSPEFPDRKTGGHVDPAVE